MKREVTIGAVKIGGTHPIAIQSMTNVPTADSGAVLAQIDELVARGCEIVRVSLPTAECGASFRDIVRHSPIPVVADIHFDYRLAILAADAGAAKVRINPGNIADEEHIRLLVSALRANGTAVRVGANSGSLPKDLADTLGVGGEALAEAVMREVALLEKYGMFDIVVAAKASSVRTTIDAYRRLNALCDYPIHIGVTEAGTLLPSAVKSSMALGALLMEGIGNTIRVSVTGDPVDEVTLARQILSYSGARQMGVEIISCPTCARTLIPVEAISQELARRTAHINQHITIAVMGCVVNGIGEGREADFGVAGGKDYSCIMSHGEILRERIPNDMITDTLTRMAEEYIRG